MKKLIYVVVGLLTVLFVTSCNKEDTVVVDSAAQLTEVSFVINVPNLASKDDTKDKTIPTCVDLDPDHVIAKINNEPYTLKLVTLNGKLETEVIKLSKPDDGSNSFTLDAFTVYAADGTVIYASPLEGSYYELLWGLEGVPKSFSVEQFKKSKVSIDVLCYQPYDYEKFGFI